MPDRIVTNPVVSKSGIIYFGADDINRLKNLELDLLIQCANGVLGVEILAVARLGVISIDHADRRLNGGGPAGFWQVYFRKDTTGFTIVRLTEQLDGGDILMRGNFQTNYYYLLNQAILFERSNYYLKSLVEKLATNKQPNVLPSFPYSNRLFGPPTAYQAVIYLTRLSGLLINRTIRRRARIDYRWRVAYTRSDWRKAVLCRSTQLQNPPSHFLADPFVVSKNGKDFCFVEDFDLQTQKGKIAVYELASGGGTLIGTVLDEPFHMSFPYIFEFDQELYMCPETSENRDIRIYKCIEFPVSLEIGKNCNGEYIRS